MLKLAQTDQQTGQKQYVPHYYNPKINVASRAKNVPPPGSHVFQPTGIIFELFQDIIRMNHLTKFHEDRTVNVASRPYKKECPAPGGHVFKANIMIFELIQDIIGKNLLTKFHEDWTINVASRVLTKKMPRPPRRPYIFGTNILSKVLARKNAPPPGSHVFQPTGIIFELVQDIIGMNLLTKFHEDWTINVASRELTRQMLTVHDGQEAITKAHYEHVVLRKNLSNPKDIIGMNLLTKFHEDWTINVASRELTRQMLTVHDGQEAITKAHYEHVVLRYQLHLHIANTNILTKFHQEWMENIAFRVKTS
ncbi:hypothetical protein DPMN_116704 [Dreissena polymorpha]|uniref:Uncharacterized protein n=1 Tax=Dreissena polymorpha TaxID=45954 RepID=A0A9D4QU67_DREPO|nr:hypothetical protein DPMN_116704 [Dreissena polymorpha]